MRKWNRRICAVLTLTVIGIFLQNRFLTKSEEAQERITIHMAITQPSGNMEDFDRVMEAVNTVIKQKLGLQLQLDFISSSSGNLLEYLTEQTEADLICVSNIKKEVSKHMLVPLDELLEEEGQAICQVMEEEYLKLGKVDGVQYAIPLNRDMAQPYGVAMRKDLVEKYEIDLLQIKTWDDVEQVLEKVTTQEKIYGIAADISMPFDPLGNYLGVLMSDDEEMQVVNYYETEEFYNWIKRLRSWKEKGYLYEIEELRYRSMSDRPFLYELVKEGQLFSYMVKYKPGINAQESKSIGTEIVSVMLGEPVITTNFAVSDQYAIYAGSKHPKEAMQMLNFLYENEEVANLLCWGIEGEHYQKNKDGTISYPEGKEESDIRYNFNLNWALPNPYLAYVWEGDPLDLESQIKLFHQEAKKSPALGFVFDESEVSIECEMVKSVANRYMSGFLCGSFDVDKMLPKMIRELKENGIDLIIEEKQRQLDEWKAEQEAT